MCTASSGDEKKVVLAQGCEMHLWQYLDLYRAQDLQVTTKL